MSNNDEIEISDRISQKIRENRKKSAVTIKQLAEHLHQKWNISVRGAREYIRYYIEGNLSHLNNNYYHLQNQSTTTFELHEKRIADYLAALGNSKKEAKDLLKGIEKIQPNFRYEHSDVEPYFFKKSDRARI